MIPSRPLRVAAAALLAVGTLAACGGSSTSATATPSAPAAQPTGSPGTRTGGFRGLSTTQLAAIRSCLTAAGITVPAAPTFSRPTGSFTRPSGTFTARPGGTGRGGAFFAALASPAAQAALKACGLSVPTRPAGGFGGGTGRPPTTS